MTSEARIQKLQAKPNIARFCVENPHVSWALLILVLFWGYYGYQKMPKSKDPNIPVRIAMVSTIWPGHEAVETEQLVTRQVEAKIAESKFLNQPDDQTFSIQSLTLPGVSLVQVQLGPDVDTDIAFNELARNLATINSSLPDGAGPITVNSSYGDTAAIMFTVASPQANAVEIALRSQEISTAITAARQLFANPPDRAAIVVPVPMAVNPAVMASAIQLFNSWISEQGLGSDIQALTGSGYMGLDFTTSASDAQLQAAIQRFLSDRLGTDRFYPDAWDAVIIRQPSDTGQQLSAAVGDRYSYSQLDAFTDTLSSNLKTVPQVSRVLRSGVLNEQITLSYSQEELAAYGIAPSRIGEILGATNTTVPGGVLPVEDMNVVLSPSGSFGSMQDIEDVILAQAADGTPVYLRNLLKVNRGYQQPPRLLNFYLSKDANGNWQRNRSISVAVQMHTGQQIDALGREVQQRLDAVRELLPEDLIIARVSDQPTQVKENVDLFMRALYEAIVLVVLIALVGFWEWRAAALMMISIPITLAMTFGFIYVLGIDVQQVSIAALIIALGLLVDDPVVAGDSIKRGLADGQDRKLAAWLGPTLLATAIFFATATNVVAYLPLLMLTGNQGDFLHSLPIVIGSALIASRIVSMTFVPFLGGMILRASTKPEKSLEERRRSGFTGMYYRFAGFAIDHRKPILLLAFVLLAAGLTTKSHLKNSFFPDDVQYLSTIDVWLKNGANIQATNAVAQQVEALVRDEAEQFAKENNIEEEVLQSISTTLGGGAPRFWFTITPQQQQSNYAQLVVRLNNKDFTPEIAPQLQTRLSREIPGADIDVRQLQTTPVNYPVAIRLSSRVQVNEAMSLQEIERLKGYAEQIRAIIASSSAARSTRTDWGGASMLADLNINNDRANLAGITNQDIALASSAALNGIQVGTYREGHKQLPIVAQLELEQRARMSDLDSLYVYSMSGQSKVPLLELATSELSMAQQRIWRLEQFRTITIFSYPGEGFLASDIMTDVQPRLDEFEATLPDGFDMAISGSQANTTQGFGNLLGVMGISALAIFFALVLQFRNLIKPLLVFATVPFGIVGALLALLIMNEPFGFMAFLGIVSLIGVIVSHIILLFDFIEERHAAGDPFREALLDAGIIRLRPVLITISATVFALIPLALEGGPLWQGLCYTQIGGLITATFATMVLVPTLYAFAVLDLKIITWEETDAVAA